MSRSERHATDDRHGPYHEPRAHALRERHLELFGGDPLPVAVAGIAEDLLGLHVGLCELELSGMLVPDERRIWLNAPESEPRRRFTLAHELGHWVCQCRGRRAVPPIYCRTGDVDEERAAGVRRLEREANIFAAELLMPEPLVRREWRRCGDVDELAGRFGVSRPAIRWRLYSFGLVDAPPGGAPLASSPAR
jgi:hypothetical protein